MICGDWAKCFYIEHVISFSSAKFDISLLRNEHSEYSGQEEMYA
jgi:hypothetical protein